MSNKKPTVVLVGPGDCASREELFHLTKWLLKDRLRLVVVGKGPFVTVRKDKWLKNDLPFIEDLLNELPEDRLCYIDVDDPQAEEKMEAVGPVELVHITSPNDDHCPSILKWVKQYSGTGYATVQKPLTSNPREGQQAVLTLGSSEAIERAGGFDHYASKVHPIFADCNSWLPQLGSIQRIEMRFLEQYSLTTHRAYTISNGMSEDWGAHVFVLLGIIASRNFTPSLEALQTMTIDQAWRGRYPMAPIPGDTFFRVTGQLMIDGSPIPFDAMAGKGIADTSEKWFRIIGEDATLVADFDSNTYAIERDGKVDKETIQPTLKAHTEVFLEQILFEEKGLSSSGVHSLESAVEITRLIREVQHRAPNLTTYPTGLYVEGVGEFAGLLDYMEKGFTAQMSPSLVLPLTKTELVNS